MRKAGCLTHVVPLLLLPLHLSRSLPADAGADLHNYRNLETDYDHVQTAANKCNMDAALKLVEAGCKWQLPKGQRVLGGSIYYAPEILTTNVPNLKVKPAATQFDWQKMQ